MTGEAGFVSLRLDRVMGCGGELSVAAAPREAHELNAVGRQLLDHLERRWSRFLPDSDISMINRAGGEAVAVDPATIELLRQMAVGVRLTGGAFDPTLLGAIAGLGYGPAWNRGQPCSPAHRAPHASSWVDGTMVDTTSSEVVIPAGVQLDAGAIGKGLAADIVASELVAAGARAARVTVGGDVRVTSPTVIGVASPRRRGVVVDRIVIAAGGVATSGIARCWTGPGGDRVHHVLDPKTARPVRRMSLHDVVQVSVVADSATTAEVLATATLVDPSDGRIDGLDRLGVGVLAVTAGGDVTTNRSWERLRRDSRGLIAVAS